MTAYTSLNPAGTWEAPGDWTPTAPAGGPSHANGDTVTINPNHTMSINSDVAIGELNDDGTGALAIDMLSGSTLRMAANTSLRYHGGVRQVAGTSVVTKFEVAEGCTITHDSSEAPSPGTTGYRWELGTATNQLATIELNGTQASPIAWNHSTTNGARAGWIGQGNSNIYCGIIKADWTNFDIGEPVTGLNVPARSVLGINVRPMSAPNGSYFRNCTFRTGVVGTQQSTLFTIAETYFENCKWLDYVVNSEQSLFLSTLDASANSYLQNCVVKGFTLFQTTAYTWSFTNCMFNGVKYGAAGNFFEHCLFRELLIDRTDFGGSVKNCVSISDDGRPNAHHMQSRNMSEIDGLILQTTHTDSGGDGIFNSLNKGAITAKRVIILLNAIGRSSSSVIADTGTTGTFWTVTNCTGTSHDGAAGFIGIAQAENSDSYTGTIARFSDCIAYGRGNPVGVKAVDRATATGGTPATDVGLSTDMDYNLGYELVEGSNGKGYDGFVFSSGSPGEHDINEDPMLVDDTRGFPTYAIDGFGQAAGVPWTDQSGDYTAGTLVSSQSTSFYENIVINFRCINNHTPLDNDPTNGRPGDSATPNWRTNWRLETWNIIENDTSQIPAMYAWIEAGFSSQNPNTAILSDPNGVGYMGAVPPVAVTSTVTASNISGSDSESFNWTEV